MEKLVYSASPEFQDAIARLADRPAYPPEAEKAAKTIIDAVASEGDAALIRFAKDFDHCELTAETLRLSEAEIREAVKKVPSVRRLAIRNAFRQITEFAVRTRPEDRIWNIRPGVKVGEKFSPLDRVGVYIPGGSAPLVSTVIHTAGIARAAGVKEIVACTPPQAVHPETIYAMKLCGISEIYRLGGAYAVAAMALGTASVPRVQKIAGPGNAYVTAAKKLLYGRVSIDLVAGPSEILIIADHTADPELVAADLLSQAEHGSGLEQSVLITTDSGLIAKVARQLKAQKKLLPREPLIDRVLENGLYCIEVPDLERAAEVANRYAPEHLELQVENPQKLCRKINAAGAVFLGHWTPEPIGDFCAGPSHVLPTASSALRFNGLSTCDFMRRSSIVEYGKRSLSREGSIAERFGEMEGLGAHAAAVSRRLAKINRKKN